MKWYCFSITALILLAWAAAGCDESGPECGDCDDGIACTLDLCDETTGDCRHEPNDSLCESGEVCDPLQGCVEAEPCTTDAECDDDNPCTDDVCDPAAGCRNTPNTADCDDGDPCTEGDRCQDGACVGGQNVCDCTQDSDCDDNDLCTDDTCDAQNQCQYANNTAACDDGDACTANDACTQGNCSGTPVNCDDGNVCTDDSCDPASGCGYLNNTTACDDSDSCTSGDVCAGGACVGEEACCGDQIDNDGDGLTDCDEAACTGDPACGGCVPVPEPDPVSDSPLPGESNPGESEYTTVNGFSDDYLYDSTGDIKIGTRRDWGGTIIFFGMKHLGFPGTNSTNTIDANDTGREVQVAFYDPDRNMQNCAHDASCASDPTDCPISITFLGWNPVQGGNRCNRGSGVESVVNQDGVLTVTTNPLFWNPNWDRTDCSTAACDDPALRDRRSDVRVVQSLRFNKKHVVELNYTVTNLSDLDHRWVHQEMPTVYTANGNNGPDLWRLFNSQGTEIAIDTPGNDGFFYENFSSPGGWATMQNDALDYGVGLYTENRLTDFQGWQLRSLPFNNFRPQFPFGIPAYGTVRARAYLLLGSHATITAEAQWLDQNLPPFGCLDAPTPDETISGSVTVRGWALDNQGVAAVEVIVDGTTVVPLSYGTGRPDVCLVWPNYANCNNVGYSGTLDTTALTECQHLLEINARDTDGNERIIARRRVTVVR